jgi:hypothetical protein
MEQISKTMRDRLAAQQNIAEHPDADLLTAYAENTLVAREREGVVSHLARCQGCRDLVLLASPEIPATAPMFHDAPHRSWFARPALRWVMAAAAVVVVGAAVTLNLEHGAGSKSAQVEAPQQTQSAQQQPGPNDNQVTAQLTAPAAPQGVVIGPTPSNATPEREAAKQTRARAQKKEGGRSEQLDRYAALQSAPAVQLHVLNTESRVDTLGRAAKDSRFQNSITLPTGVQPDKADITAALRAPAAPPLHNAPIKAAQSNAVTLAQIPASSRTAQNRAANETVEVSSAAAAAPGATQAPPSPASAPGEYAKTSKRPAISANTAVSAMKTGVVGGEAGSSARPSADAVGTDKVVCSIVADGVRCWHGQRTTELHQPTANLKVIGSAGSVVWAGGDGLLRSDDAGVTWTDVAKPSTEAIAQIVVNADAVYVRTISGTMWKTTDNGATWTQSPATK